MKPRGVCGRALKPRVFWEGPLGIAAAANRTREIRPSGMRGGLTETWAKVVAKRARTAETPKQPSHCLRPRAPYFYPTTYGQCSQIVCASSPRLSPENKLTTSLRYSTSCAVISRPLCTNKGGAGAAIAAYPSANTQPQPYFRRSLIRCFPPYCDKKIWPRSQDPEKTAVPDTCVSAEPVPSGGAQRRG